MDRSWTPFDAREVAVRCLDAMGSRWDHVQAVGAKAERVGAARPLSESIVSAAWLHDIGYAPSLTTTGFHPVDGAAYLEDLGAPHQIVSLVAFHSGAEFEAEERGLSAELAKFAPVSDADLGIVTLFDMTTGPTGNSVSEFHRLEEILGRYPQGSPVHRAVVRSSESITDMCFRARHFLGLPENWLG